MKEQSIEKKREFKIRLTFVFLLIGLGTVLYGFVSTIFGTMTIGLGIGHLMIGTINYFFEESAVSQPYREKRK